MVSTKRSNFLQNDWLPPIFSSRFHFIANKLSLGIDNYELRFLLYKIFIKFSIESMYGPNNEQANPANNSFRTNYTMTRYV